MVREKKTHTRAHAHVRRTEGRDEQRKRKIHFEMALPTEMLQRRTPVPWFVAGRVHRGILAGSQLVAKGPEEIQHHGMPEEGRRGQGGGWKKSGTRVSIIVIPVRWASVCVHPGA